jgi:hypothetical protein
MVGSLAWGGACVWVVVVAVVVCVWGGVLNSACSKAFTLTLLDKVVTMMRCCWGERWAWVVEIGARVFRVGSPVDTGDACDASAQHPARYQEWNKR